MSDAEMAKIIIALTSLELRPPMDLTRWCKIGTHISRKTNGIYISTFKVLEMQRRIKYAKYYIHYMKRV